MNAMLVTVMLPLFFLCGCSAPESATERSATLSTTSLLDPVGGGMASSVTPAERSPLYLSRDFGVSWEDVGYNLPQDVQVSFLEAYGEDILIATDNAGLFLSREERLYWDRLGADLPGRKLNALHVAGRRLLVSVYGHGLYVADVAGAPWKNLTYDLPPRNIQSILITDRLLVGTDVGVYRLEERTKHWHLISEPVQVLSLETRDGHLFAGTHLGTMLSENGGDTWRWIRREGAVHYTHLAGERVVEMAIHGGVYLSEDGGTSWTEAVYAPRAGSYVYEVVAVGDYLVMSNNYGIHRSADGGRHWQLIYPTEAMGFFDFLVKDGLLYGGTRAWAEYRGR